MCDVLIACTHANEEVRSRGERGLVDRRELGGGTQGRGCEKDRGGKGGYLTEDEAVTGGGPLKS